MLGAASMPAAAAGAVCPDGSGWYATTTGQVHTVGATTSFGQIGTALAQPIVGMAATADCRGYWLVAADGGVFAFGDARFLGSEGGRHLNQPIVGMAATADSAGYWLVAADGGVFSFGDAAFQGSTGGLKLSRPVVGLTPTATGGGYWLVASDGGVFSFGDARFHGSTGGLALRAPVVSMTPTGDGGGYWLLGADGGVFSFGDARFAGAATGTAGRALLISRDAASGPGGYAVLSSTGTLSQFGPAATAGSPAPAAPSTPGAPAGGTQGGPASSPSGGPGGSGGPAGSPSAASPGGTTAAPASTSSGSPASSGPLLSAVGAPESDQQLGSDGYRSVVIPVSWSAVEPAPGQFSTPAVQQVQSEIDQATAAGLTAAVDLGAQYAPSWVFSLPGGTRFVDQYGLAFSGPAGSGNDVANAVTDSSVRDQLGRYLAYLGAHLRHVGAVRLGGGPDNELRYPSGYSGAGPNAFWFYDPSSQATLPIGLQGWKPGSGTPQQAAQFLSYYDSALDGFGRWLVAQGQADFPTSTKVELMLPGWGQRPGEAAAAADALLIVPADEVNQGLDWSDLVPGLPADGRVVAYTTWADAPSGGSTNPAPAAFIHSLLRPGVLEGGESTGNGQSTLAGGAVMFHEAKQWNWYSVGWFFIGQNQSPSQIDALFGSS